MPKQYSLQLHTRMIIHLRLELWLCCDSVCVQDLLYVATPGEFCGVLSALTGEPSFITIMATVHSHLIAITKTNLYQ